MLLTELFTYLSKGELSKIFLASPDGRSVIEGDNQLAIAQSIQLGLSALHKRFNIKKKVLVVQLVNGRTNYPLTADYAQSNTYSEQADRHIIDTEVNPFTGGVLKIERVFTEDGYDFPLNSKVTRFSCFTPELDILTVSKEVLEGHRDLPDYLRVRKIKVEYKADHPEFIPRTGIFNPDKINIDLPRVYLQALLYFVASRVTNPMGMNNEFHMGNSWLQKYELECKQLEDNGMSVEEDLTHSRFRVNGWV